MLAIESALTLAHLAGVHRVNDHLDVDPDPTVKFEAFKGMPLKYAAALEWLRKKVVMSTQELNQLSDRAKTLAFSFVEAVNESVADKVKVTLEKHLVAGKTFDSFKKSIDRVFNKAGIGPTSRHRAETVFRTNLFSSYSAAQKQRMEDPDLADQIWGYRYVAVEDDRTRTTHLAMAGQTKPKDWSGWSIWWPPNGYNCRCTLRPVLHAERDVITVKETHPPSHVTEGRGKKAKTLELLPDEGFNSAPDIGGTL